MSAIPTHTNLSIASTSNNTPAMIPNQQITTGSYEAFVAAHRPPINQPPPPPGTRRENPREIRERLAKEWLKSNPEPKADRPPNLPYFRNFTNAYNARILELEGKKSLAPPEYVPMIKEMLEDILHRRNLVYWRIFRINDLPPEILTYIFRMVVYDSSLNMKHVVYGRVWLTWVCRRWRNLTIADPMLWNGIWFKDPPPYHRSLSWFDRAGTAPLDLRINERHEGWQGKEDEHPFTKEHMTWLLDKLFTKLSQIRTFIVTVDNWPPALVVLDKLRQAGNAGILMQIRRFELHRAGKPYVWIGPGFTPEVHRHPISLCGGRADMLTHVTLNGIHIDWHTSPLSNLTTLDIRRMALEVCPGPKRFCEMLRNSPRLHKLALDGAGPRWDRDEAIGLRPVELSHLRILVLGDASKGYARYVYSLFKAPNVRDLTLMNMTGEDYSPLVVDMMSNFKEVRILTIYTFEVDSSTQALGALVRWLHTMPLVTFLRVAQIPRHVLHAFSIGNPSQLLAENLSATAPMDRDHNSLPQPVCPQLKYLEYQNIKIDDIVSFGAVRKAMGFPLQKIYVNSSWVPEIPLSDAQRLMAIASLHISPAGANTAEENGLVP